MISKIQPRTYIEQEQTSESITFNQTVFNVLTSGAFLLIGWSLLQNGFGMVAIGFYLLAFSMGGYQKVKTDIKKAIETKKFNRRMVEPLMIIALLASQSWTVATLFLFIFFLHDTEAEFHL